MQLGSTAQVTKHQYKSETGAAVQHLALTSQAGSVPLLILSAADGTAQALELSAKPSLRWTLNTPAAVTSARIVDCAPRPRDTAAQSLLVRSVIEFDSIGTRVPIHRGLSVRFTRMIYRNSK